MNLYEKEFNGSLHRSKTTTFVVSRWYIPGGCEYDHAKNVHIFFDTQEDAERYALEYRMPPEMAEAYPIARYDYILASVSSNYRQYKKRFHADFYKDAWS